MTLMMKMLERRRKSRRKMTMTTKWILHRRLSAARDGSPEGRRQMCQLPPKRQGAVEKLKVEKR